MKKIIAFISIWSVTVLFASGQKAGTTTGGPLTIAGMPIYGIADNGDLSWYFHRGAHNGSPTWANGGGPVKVGNGWNEGLNVFKGNPDGETGVIYRIDSKGNLLWYRHLGHDTGEMKWAGSKPIGNGWQDIRLAFGAGDGLIYAIHKNGDLLWYHHLDFDNGSVSWANQGGGAKIGNGWGDMRLVFSGGQGIIYAVNRQGDLYWYHHTGYRTGVATWAKGGSFVKIGTGWNDVASAFSGGNGIIYVMKRDGNLYWYNHTGFSTGEVTWTAPTGNQIGTGWGDMVRIF